jgi:hypothetical protein
MSDLRTTLPADGACTCGSKDLMLAKDQTEYTPVSKDREWEFSASYAEQTENDDPMGNVRLFCTECGQYFFVPKELE